MCKDYLAPSRNKIYRGMSRVSMFETCFRPVSNTTVKVLYYLPLALLDKLPYEYINKWRNIVGLDFVFPSIIIISLCVGPLFTGATFCV
jgi:hypothetical protein